MPKRPRIKYRSEPALSIYRGAYNDDKLVYIGRANRDFGYDRGRSNIGYIGTTKNGVWRIAASAAHRGWTLFDEYGIKSLDFHVVTSTPIPGLKSWKNSNAHCSYDSANDSASPHGRTNRVTECGGLTKKTTLRKQSSIRSSTASERVPPPVFPLLPSTTALPRW